MIAPTQPELFVERQSGNATVFEPAELTVNRIAQPPPAPSPQQPERSVSGQASAILEYMMAGNSITPLEALQRFGCFRLGARIWDLKRMGHNIKSEPVTVNQKHVARYSMP